MLRKYKIIVIFARYMFKPSLESCDYLSFFNIVR